jgi:integrase
MLYVQKTYETGNAMASYRKLPSGNWYAELKVLNQRDAKGGFPTKGHAVAWATEREVKIRAKGSSTSPTNKSLHDALIRYQKEVTPDQKGKRWEHIRINKFMRELPFVGKLIGDVDVRDISEWRDFRLKKIKSSSINRELNVLSAVFTIAVREWLWCKHNPVRDIARPKNPKHRDRLTTSEEKQAMLGALGYVEGAAPVTVGQRVAYAYLIALETAMREGEICALEKKYIYLDKKYVHVKDSKNDDSRDVPLSSRAIELFKLVPDGVGLKTSQVDSMWRKARGKTEGKVVGLTFHDSRHQAITDLAKKLNVLELARMVGHKNPKTLMIYFNDTATTMADKLG